MVDDEILDLVNEFDEVIGTILRSDYAEILEAEDKFIRASELVIVNEDGRMWIPVRTQEKKIAPNGYDFSAAGHLEAGEGYLEAIFRETKEEIDIDLNKRNLEFVAKLKSNSIRYFRTLFVYRTNETPTFNDKDFVSAGWMSPNEILESIENGHPAKTNLADTIEIVSMYLRG